MKTGAPVSRTEACCRKPFLLVLALLVCFSAVAQTSREEIPRRKRVPSPIDSKIFLGDWWDHYNRAIHRIDQGDLRGAEADLLQAIKFHPEESRRARTYGVRFQEYYPHAELGALYFETGRYKEAIRELQLAEKTAPLLQNSFFVHEAKRQIALAEGTDRQDPTLEIFEPPSGIVTNRSSIRLAGKTSDNVYVDQIVVNGESLDVARAKSQIDFGTEVPLPREVNRILIQVEDLVGHIRTKEIIVNVDRQGPILSLTKTELASGNRALIEGLAYDKSEVVSISFDGQPLALSRATSQPLNVTLPMAQGRSSVLVALKDGFGNETVVDLNPTFKTGSVRLRERGVQVAASRFDPNWLRAASGQGPTIDLLGLESIAKIYAPEFYLDGFVRDKQGVQEVNLNEERLDIPQGGTDLYFSKLVGPLEDGEVNLQVRAKNLQGETTEEQIKFQVDSPVDLDIAQKLTVAIPDFEITRDSGDSPLSRDFLVAFTNVFSTRGRFNLVNHDAEVLNEIFKEKRLLMTDLADTRYKSTDGTLLTADILLDGQFEERETTFSARVTIVEVADNSSNHPIFEVHGPDKSPATLQTMAEGLALKVHQEFPLLHGVLDPVEPTILCAEITSQDKVRPGDPFLAVREGQVSTLRSGRTIKGPPLPLGSLSVLSVGRDSTALKPEGDMKPLEPGDLAVAR